MKEKNKFPVLEYVGEKEFIVTQAHYSSQPPVDSEEKIERFLLERKKEAEEKEKSKSISSSSSDFSFDSNV